MVSQLQLGILGIDAPLASVIDYINVSKNITCIQQYKKRKEANKLISETFVSDIM